MDGKLESTLLNRYSEEHLAHIMQRIAAPFLLHFAAKWKNVAPKLPHL